MINERDAIASWGLSKIMEYNFLADVADRLPIPFETKKEIILNNMLSENEEELKSIKKELNLLKKIHKIE